jgi:hypothetical protein
MLEDIDMRKAAPSAFGSLLALILLSGPNPAEAAAITYTFTGDGWVGALGGLAWGGPFTATFTADTSNIVPMTNQ